MATLDQMRALLSISCRWCGAAPKEACFTTVKRHGREVRIPLTTLDGGCHDLRWQDALGTGAVVMTAAVAEIRGDETPPSEVEPDEPVLVGAAIERPW